MPELTSQQEHEIGFWRGLVEHHGAGYRAFRISEYKDKTQRFEPWWTEQVGSGVDVGCGCISILEEGATCVWFIDPLVDEYKKLVVLDKDYIAMSAEVLTWPDNTFDWLFCVNMLDHTPNPAKAVAEMHRVLKSGGRLFFEVHLDDALSPAHYGLWTEQTVKNVVESVFTNCLKREVVRVDQDNQSQWWAVYQK